MLLLLLMMMTMLLLWWWCGGCGGVRVLFHPFLSALPAAMLDT
jgi:hypothetical protein